VSPIASVSAKASPARSCPGSAAWAVATSSSPDRSHRNAGEHSPTPMGAAGRIGRSGPPPPHPVRLHCGLERCGRAQRRGRPARLGQRGSRHGSLQRHRSGPHGRDRPRRLRAGSAARPLRPGRHEHRGGGVRVGPADGGRVHRCGGRLARSRRRDRACPVEWRLCGGVKRRGGRPGRLLEYLPAHTDEVPPPSRSWTPRTARHPSCAT
jgi:hypothetical protein